MLTLFESCTGYSLILTKPEPCVTSSYSYKDHTEALESISLLQNGSIPPVLLNFLQPHISSEINIADQTLSTNLNKLKFKTNFDLEVYRLARLFYAENEKENIFYSHKLAENKIKEFNVLDVMVIQAVQMLDDIDKDINSSVMRVREWYGCHFPELTEIVQDAELYLKSVLLIENRETIDIEKLKEIFENEKIVEEILKVAETSVGTELSKEDMERIQSNCETVLKTIKYKKDLTLYLKERMQNIAPNLTELVGDLIGARLIAKAGSMANLSKMAASTIQILGAEKAYFTAIKGKSNTPKYGIIFNTSIISKAEEKGRIARLLGCKIALACKVDYFEGSKNGEFGIKMRNEMEERMGKSKKKVKEIKKMEKHEFTNKKKYDTSKDDSRKKVKNE